MATKTLKTRTTTKKATRIDVQDKFIAMRDDMRHCMIERGGEIDVVLTALLCKEHCVLVGPPGTAKSFLLDALMGWIAEKDAVKFTCLFNKFTTPEEVFGPVSVAGLKADVYRRITRNKLPEAHVAFCDEIFKASSAILNTMLRVLNERQYDNGEGALVECPLRLCVAASNEWPGDDGGKELGALFDRFLFRKTVKPISKAGRERLLWDGPHHIQLSTSITPDEIDQAAEEVDDLEFTDEAKKVMGDILDELNREGIYPGDRRMYKSIRAARAFAYLCGDSEVQPQHLEILSHILWDDPSEQPEKCAKIVTRLANPDAARVNELLLQTHDVLEKATPTNAVPKLREIAKQLTMLKCESASQAHEYVTKQIKIQYDKVING